MPFVTLNMAMTADGKITSVRREYPKFTSSEDQLNMDRLRAEADAVLVGAGTLRGDNPNLYVRSPAMQDYRRSVGKHEPLAAVVLSTSLDFPGRCRFYDHPGPCIVVTTERADAAKVAEVEAHAEVWRLGRDAIDLTALLERLEGRGFSHILVEGGAETNWEFLRQDLFDELNITVAPVLLGGRQAPTIVGGEGFAMGHQRRLTLLEARVVGDEIFCRYRVAKG